MTSDINTQIINDEVAKSDRHCLELTGQVRSLKSDKKNIGREKMEVQEALRISMESGQALKDALLKAEIRIAELKCQQDSDATAYHKLAAEKAALQKRLELLLNPPDSDSE